VIDFGLEGTVAIVTGASRGLGRAAAEALLDQGASVVGAARRVDLLEELAASAPSRVHAVKVDMRNMDAVEALPALAVEQFGRLDIVVNNAGIAPAGAFLEQSLDVWRNVVEVNVIAPAMLARAAGRILVPQGSGKIVNVASIAGILGKPALVAYSASKGAVLQMTKALGAEWAKARVQVNAIAPGAFATDAQQTMLESPEILERRLLKIPAARMGEPAEIGPLICYLSSRLSDFVTGAVFVIDGGEVSTL
jgi:2-deoxy-D-gluconate 3-dehydrogenase